MTHPYQDPTRLIEAFIDDSLARVAPFEKMWQLYAQRPAIEHLGAPACNGWVDLGAARPLTAKFDVVLS